MTSLAKVPVVWSGLPGFPGVSVFYSSAATGGSACAALFAFFTAIKGQFPTGLTWTFPTSGDVFDDSDGGLTGAWTGGTAAPVAANGGAGIYAAGTGSVVRWDTSAIVGRRRLKGRTFLCPLLSSVYDNNGTIQDPTVAAWQTAANTLVASGALHIWHRPSPGGSDGTSSSVTAAAVQDRVASLRSRRT